jgi:hypothetical protein
VARFEHDSHVLNLLDTPGHRDFSEDTYRVLSGVDAAVMVIDAARGVEPQTEKLYAVCKARGTPGHHLREQDGPALPGPLAILDDIEATLGLVGPARDLADQARRAASRGWSTGATARLPLRGRGGPRWADGAGGRGA